MRIDTNGNLKLNRFTDSPGMLYVDSVGTLRSGYSTANAPCGIGIPSLTWL